MNKAVTSVYSVMIIGLVGFLFAYASVSHATNRSELIRDIRESGVQFIEYGDLKTVSLPTDDFYIFDTAELTECQMQILQNIVSLINTYPKVPINIAGFTDEVGDPNARQRLSFQRAQMVLAYLWSQGIELNRLSATGYGRYYDIASNRTIQGSGMNRRIEIQWRV